MAGLGIRIFTDEYVDGRLAGQLRRRGYDAVSCAEARRHNQKISDEEQLEYATREGRAIIVYNVHDYVQLDGAWKAAGREHSGIIVAQSGTPIGSLVRWVVCHLDARTPADQYDTLLWLAPC
jgi:hypothetical protein